MDGAEDVLIHITLDDAEVEYLIENGLVELEDYRGKRNAAGCNPPGYRP